jgi:hypothetical protein
MLAPYITLEELHRVASIKSQFGHKHFTLCGNGAKSSAAVMEAIDPISGHRDSTEISPYFPTAFMQALSALRPAHPRSGNVAGCLYQAFAQMREGVNQELMPFANFASTHEYLAASFPDPSLIPERGYVRGLRKAELKLATQFLTNLKMLEVVGPTRVGKTNFIRELLAEFEPVLVNAVEPLPPIVVLKARSVADILRALGQQLGSFSPERLQNLGESELFDSLLGSKIVYWIRDFDIGSVPAIELFSARLRSLAAKGSAYWILEEVSREADLAVGEGAAGYVSLRPLENAAMAKVLEKQTPCANHPDISTVIEAAKGIPDTAILYWTTGKYGRLSERLDRYAHFQRSLPKNQRKYVAALAYVIDEAPLGCTTRLAEEWCKAVLGRAGGEDVSHAVREVLRQAHEQRLIEIEVFGSLSSSSGFFDNEPDRTSSDVARALAERLQPAALNDARMAWIQVVDPHFIEEFKSRAGDEQLRKWHEELANVILMAVEDDLSLTGISFWLLSGDVLPFVRSSFRTSSSSPLKLAAWVERQSERAALNLDAPDQSYLEHWLKWTMDHYWDDPRQTRSTEKLSHPSYTSKLQIALYDVARARGQFYRDNGLCDFEAWEAAANEFRTSGRLELWAEATLRRAQALIIPPSSNYQECWRLMNLVLAEEEKLSDGGCRGLVYFHVLSFLNKKKDLLRYLPQLADNAPTLTQNYALKLAENGFRTENMHSVANSTFFYVRALMDRKNPPSEDEVNSYALLMRFVQRVSPARKVQSLQTEGSLHRHFCRFDRVPWEEFRDHAEEALSIYERTGEAAERARMKAQVANSLSYSGSILVMSMRYRTTEELHDWLIKMLPKVYRLTERALSGKDPIQKQDLAQDADEPVWLNLQKHYVIQSWLMTTLVDPSQLGSLQEKISAALDEYIAAAASLEFSRRRKCYQGILSELTRSMRSTSAVEAHAAAVTACGQAFRPLIAEAVALSPVTTRARERSKFFETVVKFQRTLGSD